MNSLLQLESNNKYMQCIIYEAVGTTNNPLPFLRQTSPLNNYTYLCIQVLAFPTLFPYGDGNITFCDRNLCILIADLNCYLLKYLYLDLYNDTYIYPFTLHD